MENKQKIPAIISDIDGVLVRGGNALPGVAESIKLLKTPLNKLNEKKFN